MPDFTAMLWVFHPGVPGPQHCSTWPAPCSLSLRARSGPCAPSASGLCRQEAAGTGAPGSSLQMPSRLLGVSAALFFSRVTPRCLFCSGSQQCLAGFNSSCPHAFLISISHPQLVFPGVISQGNYLALTDVSLHDETFIYHFTF